MTILTDKRVVDIVAELYGDDPQFDDLLWPSANAGVCVGLRRIDDNDVVVFRGSVTDQDFERDFLAVPALSPIPQMGWVHPGFAEGLDATFERVQPLLRRGNVRTIVCGHSLGAGRAALLGAALLVDEPTINIQAVLFGEPRSGCKSLKALWAHNPYRSYRNADPSGAGHDLITDVPPEPPYERNRALIDVFAKPAAGDPWSVFKYHHIQLYQAALA